ncbi:mechanosensitive ion channel protein MscS [Nostoc minutum NIES-26]|uniref:Mechanosensitive ion channel protein MscS n=1 Tax=Nostoc minutum NIES-26 TaxID=1844469 RepID=A0A367S008_9NOSO|nr:mechanosensitive ion channel protein MscS [Nostoc minutum NIES-26]
MTIFTVELVSPLWQNSLDMALEVWKKWLDLGFAVVPKIIWAIGILFLTRLAMNFIGRFLRKALARTEPTLRHFLIQAAEILTLLSGAVAALNQVGIQTTSIVAVLAAAGLAVGLALQNTLSHFAAGVIIISMRPFEVGDYIEGGGVAGVVDGVGIFSTTLITRDNVQITVPNGLLFSGTLRNTSALGTRRVDLEIDIGDRPIEMTITHLLTLVQSHPLVLDRPPSTCDVTSISPTTTVLYLRPWCTAEDYDRVRSQVLQLVKEALREIPDTDNPMQ